MTVVELLVVAAIVALIGSLVLSAVQQARERARSTECLNRLRQFGTASTSYHSARGTFPPTSVGFHVQLGLLRSLSPHVALLPYFEQVSLAHQVNLREQGMGDIPGSAPSSVLNAAVLGSTVPIFLCPSDEPVIGGNSYRANFGIGPGLSHLSPTSANGTGAFANWKPMRPADFRDGLSSTVLFSERLVGSGPSSDADPARDLYIYRGAIETVGDCESDCPLAWAGKPDRYLGTTWLFGGYRHTWYNHVFPPNFHVVDCATVAAGGGNGAFSARSFHVGGVNVLLADGSARLASESIDIAIWRALGTRASSDNTLGAF